VRLVNSRFCKENGWRGDDGKEQWDKSAAWSALLVKNNIGYRFVRCEELADTSALIKENTPLILDSVGCVSGEQFNAVKTYLAKGGSAWLALPFGTHDEKGFRRKSPLSDELLGIRYKKLTVIDTVTSSDPLTKLIGEKKISPVLKQLAGDKRWAARIRFYRGKPVIHFLSTGLVAVPHPSIKDMGGVPVLKDIGSVIEDNNLSYEIDTGKVPLSGLIVKSPEFGEEIRKAVIQASRRGYSTVNINLNGVRVYAVAETEQ
jgi:hypothetical protein